MKVTEFLKRFEELGYDEETNLRFGAFDSYGDWHEFDFEVEDEDRKLNPDDNCIAVTIEVSDKYLKHELNKELVLDSLEDEICNAVRRVIDEFEVR